MIHQYSNDPDVAEAAKTASDMIEKTLSELPVATQYDYGGHELKLGDYDVCQVCARSIAESQQAAHALDTLADITEDEDVASHVRLAVRMFNLESEISQIRAELHNGQSSERIVNAVLGFVYDRKIHDTYGHSHEGIN